MARRLTAFSKILITALIVGAIFFAVKFLMPGLAEKMNNNSGGENTEVVDEKPAQQETDHKETTKPKPTTETTRSFNYTPKAPVGGTLKGVVELGAAGFNSFIVKIDNNKNWKLEKAEWGNSLVYDGLSSGEDVRIGLKKYIAGMLDYGVSGRNIHFVVSSGATKVPTTMKIIKELKKMGYVVNPVTPEKEAYYALKCVLPKEYYDDAFVVDIGSGNTKISWMQGGKNKSIEAYGAKYYKNGTPDNQVYAEVKAKAKTIPPDHRNTCFIIGGVPYKLAKEIRNGKERFTVLKAPEDYSFDEAKLKSGLNIYKAIADGTGCDTFVFDWESNFTIGFLLTL